MKKFVKSILAFTMIFIMLGSINIQYLHAQDNAFSGSLTGYSQLDSKIDGILNQIIQPTMADEEKVKAIYDYLIFNYEHKSDNNITMLDMSDPNPLQIVALGASHLFNDGYGVCDDFSAAFYVLAIRAGFECNIAGGSYINRDGTKMPHAWNQVKIGGEWFWVDVDVEGSVYRNQNLDKPLYYLYLKNDEEWKDTHQWDFSKYPASGQPEPAKVAAPVSQPASEPAPQPASAPPEPAPSTAASSNYSVKLDGTKLNLTLPILNVGNRLMYPFRECLEAMGATIGWDAGTRTASGQLDNHIVEFVLDSSSYTINGVKNEMDAGVTAFINDGRTYIPLRYAAEALGFNVAWDGATQTVLIESVASGDGELAKKQIAALAEYKKKLPNFEVTMRATDGTIFIDGQQYSFPKKTDATGGNVLPVFKSNKMLAGVYPTSWGNEEYISFTAFNSSLTKIGSNQKLQNTPEQLASTAFALRGGDCIVWNNGAVSIGLFMLPDSTSPSKAKLSLMTWFTCEEDLTTNIASHEFIEMVSSTDTYRMNSSTGFDMEFAKQIWDAIASLDKATSMVDIMAAKETCTLPT